MSIDNKLNDTLEKLINYGRETPLICHCIRCAQKEADRQGVPFFKQMMHLCPDCGNKRCPKATDHKNKCTGSNEPGQTGSDY